MHDVSNVDKEVAFAIADVHVNELLVAMGLVPWTRIEDGRNGFFGHGLTRQDAGAQASLCFVLRSNFLAKLGHAIQTSK